MKNIGIIVLILSLPVLLKGQNFQNLTFGTDSTLEIISWNIEWFPKNNQTTVNYVSQIISALNADVFALQEIKDTIKFKQMVAGLNGYSYFFRSSYFAGLAYIYKTNVVEINNIYQIYTTTPYWKIFPRAPMVMDFNYKNENYIIINNHFKCCGDNVIDYGNIDDEEYRRLQASELLKDYIENYFGDKKVFVVGDLNDIINEPASTNVFMPFFDMPDKYRFADMAIAQGNSAFWSYPSWPSHLDHILVTNEMFDVLDNQSTTIETIRLDKYFNSWSQYDNNVSDHRPIGIKFMADHNVKVTQDITKNSFFVYPNPANDFVKIDIPTNCNNCTIGIYNLLGSIIFEKIDNWNNTTVINTSNLSEGLYFIWFSNNGELIKTLTLQVLH